MALANHPSKRYPDTSWIKLTSVGAGRAAVAYSSSSPILEVECGDNDPPSQEARVPHKAGAQPGMIPIPPHEHRLPHQL